MPKESLVPFCSPPASLSAGLQRQWDSLAGQLIGETWASLWQKVLPGLMSWGILGEELKLGIAYWCFYSVQVRPRRPH